MPFQHMPRPPSVRAESADRAALAPGAGRTWPITAAERALDTAISQHTSRGTIPPLCVRRKTSWLLAESDHLSTTPPSRPSRHLCAQATCHAVLGCGHADQGYRSRATENCIRKQRNDSFTVLTARASGARTDGGVWEVIFQSIGHRDAHDLFDGRRHQCPVRDGPPGCGHVGPASDAV